MNLLDVKQINSLLYNPSWDIVAIFVFLSVGFFYGLWAGRARILAFLFSLYVSGFLFENFYYLDKIVKGGTMIERFWFEALIFLFLAVVLTFVFSSIFEPSFDTGPKNWFKSFLLSFSSTGLLFSYLFHVFPAKGVFTFSPLVQSLFASDNAFFWWLFIPLISIFFTRK